jgi:hypothetical protein
MKHNQYRIRTNVWLYPGNAGWYFVTIPKDISEDIQQGFSDRARGWGSLPVLAAIGSTIWKTSIFPDKKLEAYLLPLKADVRKKEGIHENSTVSLLLEIKV